MQRPTLPDWESRNFSLGDTVEAIEKQNGQNADLVKFGNDIVQYVEDSVEALLTAGGTIFPTIAAGMAAAPNDGYFYAENPDSNVSKTLYQRLSETDYRKVADDPSAEFLEGVAAAQYAALEMASQPHRLTSIFPKNDMPAPAYTVADKRGRGMSQWDPAGLLINRSRAVFPKNDSDLASFGIYDQKNRPVYAVDQYRQPITPWLRVFPKSDSQPEYCHVDKNLTVFLAWNSEGRFEIGGGDSSNLPTTPQGIQDGRLWSDGHNVVMRPDYSDLFYTPVNTLWPTHVDVNDAYHALVAELPDYVSSNLLGVDAWDNEIWEFYFKPPGQSPHNTAYSDETIRLQKYLILGGVHAGTEKHAMVANYIFFEQLCREWKQWDRLDTFRWDVEFKTIPCLNPSGYDAGTRPNGNNIDLNRNAPTGWEVAGSGRGPSPASELETQIALAWAAANLDADLIVDHHRNRNLQNDQFGWIATDSDKGLAFAIKTVNQIVAFGKKHFDFIPQDNSNVRFVGQHINGSIMLDTHTNTPVESFLLETVRDVAGASNAIYTRRYLSVEALKIFLWNFYRKKQREREEFMPVVPTAGGGDDSEEDV